MTRCERSLFISFVLTVGLTSVQIRTAYAQAQGATATLTGQVTDRTGAVVPGAEVTITATKTGAKAVTTSNGEGYYKFSFLAPTSYSLRAAKQGFSDIAIPDITLDVNQTASVDIRMEPGKLVQEVTVSGSSVALETQTSSAGAVVSEQRIAQLPLSLRDPTGLVNLVPGVVADNRTPGFGAFERNGLSMQGRLDFSANGGIREQAVAMVDGVDVTVVNGFFTSNPIIPTPEVTQEFQVITNNYPAEYGRGNVVLNIVLKSGTNQYHGDVYDFLQNSSLNAQNFFLNRAHQKKTPARRNQYGFAAGGPIIKNKMWVFGDYEKFDQVRALPVTTRVATSAEESGNFSNEFTTSGKPITIYNPFDTFVDTDGRTKRRPFLNNQIGAGLINPFATNILKFYPAPNNPGLLGPGGQITNIGNLQVGAATEPTWTRWDVKGDWAPNDRNRFMYRWSQSLFVNPLADVYHSLASPVELSNRNNFQPGKNTVFSWTFTASPTLVITQAASYARLIDQTKFPPGYKGYNVSSLGGPFTDGRIAAYANKYSGGITFPYVSIGGFGSLGQTFGAQVHEPHGNFVYQIGLVKTRGAHTLKEGFQFSIRDTNEDHNFGTGGLYNFAGSFTNGPDPLLPSANTGNALADFLLGLPSPGPQTGLPTGYVDVTRSKYAAWYFQDDWRVTPKLTLNLGVRYDFEVPLTERKNRFSRLNRLLPNPIGQMTGPNTGGGTLNQYFMNLVGHPLLGAVVFPGTNGVSRSIDGTDFSNLSPRLGAAYRIREKIVVRGGFARIYGLSPVGSEPPSNNPPGSSTNTSYVSTLDGINPNITINNPFPAGFNVPTGAMLGPLTRLGQALLVGATGNGVSKTPYSFQWNGGFEFQLPGNSVLSIAYAGSRWHRLTCPYILCTDQIPYPLIQKYGSQVNKLVPNPFFGIITDPTSPLSVPKVQMGRLLKANPQYFAVIGLIPAWRGPNGDDFKSAFESFQVGYQKRYSQGVNIQLAYTLSKNITNADSFEAGFLGPVVPYQTNDNFRQERSLSAEDATHKLVVGYLWELPLGHGKKFGSSMPSAMNQIAGGWQLSGISSWQSGFPLPISVTPNNLGAFAVGGPTGLRAHLIGNPCLSGSRSRGEKILGYVNPAAFQAPPPFTLGDAPRLLNCRGDAIKNFDISIIKYFPIKEERKVEFRAEMFNAFNRTQLSLPNMTFGSGSFGQITSATNQPRIIQLALKVHF